MVRVEARLNGDALVVSVSDEGAGFKPRLNGSESGLGLALMATLAASLTVDRQAGTGTRVSMRFR
jgi:signal transduction histidine kinase